MICYFDIFSNLWYFNYIEIHFLPLSQKSAILKIDTCPFHKWDMITHTKRVMAFNPGRVQLYPRVATHLKHTITYHTPEQKWHHSRSNRQKSIIEGCF